MKCRWDTMADGVRAPRRDIATDHALTTNRA
jgi:hypothetical protein